MHWCPQGSAIPFCATSDREPPLVVTPDNLATLAEAIGRANLLADARFSDAAKLAANMAQLTAILDEVFSAQPMAHWHDVLARAQITFDVVKEPGEVVKDPQSSENGIVVPIRRRLDASRAVPAAVSEVNETARALLRVAVHAACSFSSLLQQPPSAPIQGIYRHAAGPTDLAKVIHTRGLRQ